jgi:MFS family permease
MVAGAALIGRRLTQDRLLWSMAMAAVVNGAAIFAAAALKSFPAAVALFVVGGIANGVETVGMRSLLVHRVADRYRGRAFASYGALVNGMQIGATAAAGAIVAGLGGRAALLIGGAGTAIVGVGGLVAAGALERRTERARAEPSATVRVPEPAGPQVEIAEPTVTQLPESEPVERAIEP